MISAKITDESNQSLKKGTKLCFIDDEARLSLDKSNQSKMNEKNFRNSLQQLNHEELRIMNLIALIPCKIVQEKRKRTVCEYRELNHTKSEYGGKEHCAL